MLSHRLAPGAVRLLRKQAVEAAYQANRFQVNATSMQDFAFPPAWLTVPHEVLDQASPKAVKRAEATAQAISQAAARACESLLLHVDDWSQCMHASAIDNPIRVGQDSREGDDSAGQGAAPQWPALQLFDFWGRVYGDLALWAPQYELTPHLASAGSGACDLSRCCRAVVSHSR